VKFVRWPIWKLEIFIVETTKVGSRELHCPTLIIEVKPWLKDDQHLSDGIVQQILPFIDEVELLKF
jgi:hypothetical protein